LLEVLIRGSILPQKHNSQWTISKPPQNQLKLYILSIGVRSHHISNLGIFWYRFLEILIRNSIRSQTDHTGGVWVLRFVVWLCWGELSDELEFRKDFNICQNMLYEFCYLFSFNLWTSYLVRIYFLQGCDSLFWECPSSIKIFNRLQHSFWTI
jgi:hypothetical protein